MLGTCIWSVEMHHVWIWWWYEINEVHLQLADFLIYLRILIRTEPLEVPCNLKALFSGHHLLIDA